MNTWDSLTKFGKALAVLAFFFLIVLPAIKVFVQLIGSQ
jgi:hypothetical protein